MPEMEGKHIMTKIKDKPSTVKQLAAAMVALGQYTGENTDTEHVAEAAHLGGMKAYQMRLANALLGIVEVDAMLSETLGVSAEQVQVAHQQALISAGVEGHPGKLLNFLRWRTLRVGGPLREIAQNTEVGPLPLSAAHAAEGLQLLLGVCAAGQDLEMADLSEMTANLKAAREALTNALTNLDIMLKLLAQAEDLFS
jgi:hypothetical protein